MNNPYCSYDAYDDCFDEPSEFDKKCEELIDLLRSNATEQIKKELAKKDAEIERLKTLNATMQDVYNNYKAKVDELERIKADYRYKETRLRDDITDQVRRERLSVLMKDLYTTLYRVINIGKEQLKCDKCDEKGFVHYKTPSGRDATERCSCRERLPYYIVEESNLVSFERNDNTKIHGFFRLNKNHCGDDDYFTKDLYTNDMLYKDQPFEEIKLQDTYFADENKAQEYADWLNSNCENKLIT